MKKWYILNRERIPEQIVHAYGSVAFDTFTVTHDITKYIRAKVFYELKKKYAGQFFYCWRREKL